MLFRTTRTHSRRMVSSVCLLLALLVFNVPLVDPAEAQTKDQAQAERQLSGKQEVQAALSQLKLPENPSRDDSARFIEKARDYVEQMSALGVSLPSEIDVSVLKQVPPVHFDLLVVEIANDTRLRMYVPVAVQAMNLDAEEIKQRIIENLDDTPANIGVLINNGWCDDARAIIMEKITRAQQPVNLSWFAAAIELREPKLYKKLHELTIASKDADDMLVMLEALPDYDLRFTLQTVVKRIDSGKLKVKRKASLEANNIRDLRIKAAENGDLESLAWLVEKLSDQPSPYPSLWHYVNVRLPVIKLIDFKGDNQEVKAWFKENRDRLVYDGFRRRFVIPDDDF